MNDEDRSDKYEKLLDTYANIAKENDRLKKSGS